MLASKYKLLSGYLLACCCFILTMHDDGDAFVLPLNNGWLLLLLLPGTIIIGHGTAKKAMMVPKINSPFLLRQ